MVECARARGAMQQVFTIAGPEGNQAGLKVGRIHAIQQSEFRQPMNHRESVSPGISQFPNRDSERTLLPEGRPGSQGFRIVVRKEVVKAFRRDGHAPL